MKTSIQVILVLIIVLAIDGVLAWFALPIKTMDLIISAISLFFLLALIRLRSGLEQYVNQQAIAGFSFRKKAVYSLFLLMLAFGSALLVWFGLTDFWVLFTGVKGSVHGYSVALLGSVICVYSLLGLFALWRYAE